MEGVHANGGLGTKWPLGPFQPKPLCDSTILSWKWFLIESVLYQFLSSGKPAASLICSAALAIGLISLSWDFVWLLCYSYSSCSTVFLVSICQSLLVAVFLWVYYSFFFIFTPQFSFWYTPDILDKLETVCHLAITNNCTVFTLFYPDFLYPLLL